MKPPKIVEKLCGSVCIRRWTSLSTFPSGSSPVRTVCFSDSSWSASNQLVGAKLANLMCLFACSCDQRLSGAGRRCDRKTRRINRVVCLGWSNAKRSWLVGGVLGGFRRGGLSKGRLGVTGWYGGQWMLCRQRFAIRDKLPPLVALELAVKARRRQMLVLTSQQKANAHAAPQVLPHPS